ncbi:MAG: transketolase C-terminal domain-containing protein [Acholeplasmataceae bacterium]
MGNYLQNKLLKEGQVDFSGSFKKLVFNLLDENPEIVLGDADLGRAMYGEEYRELKNRYPKQMYDTGIAEANMFGIASGLSLMGKIPIVHTFAAFASRRVFDTLFISGAYAGLNIKVIGSDPGITSTYNGGTHSTFEDIGLMRSIPNAIIFEPADNVALNQVFPQLINHYGISYIRLPRKIKPLRIYPEEEKFEIGRAKRLREGTDATVIALGTEIPEALKAAELLQSEGINLRVVDPVTVCPFDVDELLSAIHETGAIITAENHSIKTGLCAEVSRLIVETHPCPLEALGIKDEFGEVGDYDELLSRFSLTSSSIASAVKKCLRRKS